MQERSSGRVLGYVACLERHCMKMYTFLLLPLQNEERNSSLQLASMEQKKADENVLRLVEEQKV